VSPELAAKPPIHLPVEVCLEHVIFGAVSEPGLLFLVPKNSSDSPSKIGDPRVRVLTPFGVEELCRRRALSCREVCPEGGVCGSVSVYVTGRCFV
jgi:hypothetical protein